MSEASFILICNAV